MAAAASSTAIGDLPDVILCNIFALVSDPRARNSLSLVSRKFLALERATRVSLTLRGNARDLFMVPGCFRPVSSLDLSFLSPWGHSLLASSPADHQSLLARRLRDCFPSVESLSVYSRSPASLDLLLPHWPKLRRIKLVRWHQRPAGIPLGGDFVPIFEHCGSLESLDLSAFYHWTEDLPPVLRAYPNVSAKLTRLNLMTASFTEGYKSSEIAEITKSCPNLSDFRVACTFDPRYFGFVGDETLSAVASNCPKLSLLHMVDTTSLANPRAGPDGDGGGGGGDARITPAMLVEVFSALPNLEELALDVGKNVKQSGVALEAMNTKCRKLRALKLGQFQEVCSAVDWRRLDGVSLCGGLRWLSIKNSGDLSDMGLVAIGRGCCKLTKFEVQGCDNITVKGLRTMASLLRKTLTDVTVACCKNLVAAASLRAMEPIRDRIRRLHIDCVWSEPEGAYGFDLNEANGDEEEVSEANGYSEREEDMERRQKRCKYASEEDHLFPGSNGDNGIWEKLEYLSLWINVGDLLTPLPMAGLDDCPNLEEIRIKIEGDCRGRQPTDSEFGLSSLAQYPKLSRMQLDCGNTIGYVLTAPPKQMDLSLWERYFLNEIRGLRLSELHYWPPQDRDVNQRSLSLPAVGLLQECLSLRKLFIHGTAHEHFMMFFPRIPNLRDVQLREDYYPAPENDMSTEMRVASCSRFEDALNSRFIQD